MRTLNRDENGRFKDVILSADEAKKMAEQRWSNERHSSFSRLLESAGLTVETCPEHLRVLAQIAVSKKTAAVSALKAFLVLTGQASGDNTNVPALRKPLPGETCPLCGTLIETIPAEDALRMLRAMGDLGQESTLEAKK